MKTSLSILFFILVFAACNNSSTKQAVIDSEKKDSVEKQSFFPVTNYIKGQLYEIKNKSINPLKYTTVNNHTDSAWLKIEALETAVKEFLYPEIDSVNLISLFTETKFADQTLDAYTFTYDATVLLPDTMTLKHWDVYIDPATNNVKRIYLVKTIEKNKTLQLTWQSNEWCKITTIITDKNGVSSVVKEEKITWDF